MNGNFYPKGTLKDRIIETLSKKFPSTAKELHAECCQNNSCTYQAVHKALHELLNDKIVKNIDSNSNYSTP